MGKLSMNNLSYFPYPLVFQPVYKDYIWGGRSLERFGKSLPGKRVAESWEISAHPDGMSIVASGIYKGWTLAEMAEKFGEKILGSLSYKKYQNKFPILLKLIDAESWLSVQVHPDDDYSNLHENDMGKTEAWYVLDAKPDTNIIHGLKYNIKREELQKILDDGRIVEILRNVEIQKEDVIYIPAGTVHAAGKGMLIVEVQQSSNATYRLYDHDRKNPDGTSRPLHISKALDTIDYENATQNAKCNGLAYEKDGLFIRVIIADPHFCTEIVEVKEKASLFADGRSFMAYIFFDGKSVLEWENGSIDISAGQSVLIPACLGKYSLKGKLKALRAYIGDIYTDIIKPLSENGYTQEQMLASIGGIKQGIS
jgi:mannose-6-phosphate isomerase